MRRLVWFRADLRVRDNTALWHACGGETAADRPDGGVVGVFTICPRQWREEHDWGGAKVGFVLACLRELREALAKLNVPLKIVEVEDFAGVPGALSALAGELGCDELWFNREYELNERRRDEAVTAAFERSGRRVRSFTDQVVLEPGTVRTGEEKYYTVFSPFKKKWIEVYHEGRGAVVVGTPQVQKKIDVAADRVPGEVLGFELSEFRADLWKAGEGHALGRLEAFCERRIHGYHAQRNMPSINGTSTLSPYLAMGVVSPRQCLVAAAEANAAGGVGPDGKKTQAAREGGGVNAEQTSPALWISELIWREFYKHILVGFERVNRHEPFQRRTRAIEWDRDDKKFSAWCQGRTGYPLVDAAMRQLNQTGWMHNRLRMITAMFLTKDLFLDWRLGERYFMQKLVDGDLAANNGGWQWSASTGTDAQPYFRVFNPITQSEQFDPEGEFIRRFVPELKDVGAKDIHDPKKLGKLGLFKRLEYPGPIVDHKAARERAIAAFAGL
jgi:deoxyribodipyrimidine photo-lyase